MNCAYSIHCNECAKLLSYCNENLYYHNHNYFQCIDCAEKEEDKK